MSVLPTDITELTALLRSTPPGEWPDVDDLAAQIGDRGRAVKLFSAAENEIWRDNEIDTLRADIDTALTEATARLREAEHAIDRLASSQVYDVEYAEGLTADDLRHQLAEAARSIRIARVLKKQIDS